MTTASKATKAQRNYLLSLLGLPFQGSKGNATTAFICLEAGWVARPEGPGNLNRYGYAEEGPGWVVTLEGERAAGL